MRVNRGLLFWGLVILSAGVAALAIQQRIVDRDVIADAWRLWPLVLIALGVALIASRTPYAFLGAGLAAVIIGLIAGSAIAFGPGFAISCGGDSQSATLIDHRGSLGSTATLDWHQDCGSLQVRMGDGSAWIAAVGDERGEQPTVEAKADSLEIHS